MFDRFDHASASAIGRGESKSLFHGASYGVSTNGFEGILKTWRARPAKRGDKRTNPAVSHWELSNSQPKKFSARQSFSMMLRHGMHGHFGGLARQVIAERHAFALNANFVTKI
jgi:hypothetical protein